MQNTFLFHDYETWGADAKRDRPSQFAAIRTDERLNPIGEPIMLHCRMAEDYLPSAGACLVTGVTPSDPQIAHGMREYDFFREIQRALSVPGTCGVGYNSVRFDDEVTRFGLWRNFMAPYAHTWGEGRSRWDILPYLRAAYSVLRGKPEMQAAFQWPVIDGRPSMRLEKLSEANGIAHRAHDALGDVEVLIEIVRRVRSGNENFFRYAMKLRNKGFITEMINPFAASPQMLLTVASTVPAENGYMTAVLPIGLHPREQGKSWNSVIAVDLSQDIEPLLDLSAEDIRKHLFTSKADRGADWQSIGLSEIKANQMPFVCPRSALDAHPEVIELNQLDLAAMERRAAQLNAPGVKEAIRMKLSGIYGQEYGPSDDPDAALYDGFLDRDDEKRMIEVRRLADTRPEDLASLGVGYFKDARLNLLLPRFQARNWPETLSESKATAWSRHCAERLSDDAVAALRQEIQEIRDLQAGATPSAIDILNRLSGWLDARFPRPQNTPRAFEGLL